MNYVIILTLAFSFLLPVGLLVWWKRKTGAKLWCFLAGAVCFFLFANILESLMHQAVLYGTGPVSVAIQGSPALYVLYGCLAAGVFEETGRLFGFKVLLKNHAEKECAAAYGIGHGGIEVILTLGAVYVLYYLASLGVQVAEPETNAVFAGLASSISLGSASVAMLERVSAMMLHVGLSMLMFTACREKGRRWACLACIGLHALADVPACLYQTGVLTSLGIVEALTFGFGIACLLIGKNALARYQVPGEAVSYAEN